MTLQEFIDKYKGKEIDFDGAYQGQCVDLFRQYIKECLTGNQPKGVTGAADFWTNYDSDPNLNKYFEKIPNTQEFIPKEGDVMIWNKRAGGGFGHVAVVKQASQDNFISFDQNWSKISYCELVDHKYTNVYGVLRPEETMTSDEIAVKKTDFENLVKKSTMFDEILAKYNVPDAQGLYNMVAGKDARITDLGNQLGTYQAETKNKEELLSRCQQEVLNLQDEINGLQSRLDQSNNTVTQLGKDKGSLAIQVAQLTTQLETARRGTYTITVAEFFKLLWNQKLSISKG